MTARRFIPWKSGAIAIIGFAAILGFGLSLKAAPGDDTLKLPKLELRESKLDNGLRVILVPDHTRAGLRH